MAAYGYVGACLLCACVRFEVSVDVCVCVFVCMCVRARVAECKYVNRPKLLRCQNDTNVA